MYIRKKGKLFHCQHGNSKDRNKYYKLLNFLGPVISSFYIHSHPSVSLINDERFKHLKLNVPLNSISPVVHGLGAIFPK